MVLVSGSTFDKQASSPTTNVGGFANYGDHAEVNISHSIYSVRELRENGPQQSGSAFADAFILGLKAAFPPNSKMAYADYNCAILVDADGNLSCSNSGAPVTNADGDFDVKITPKQSGDGTPSVTFEFDFENNAILLEMTVSIWPPILVPVNFKKSENSGTFKIEVRPCRVPKEK